MMKTDLEASPARPTPLWALLPILGLALHPSPASAADRNRALARVVAAAANQAQPTVTVLPAASGAVLQSYESGSAILSLGRAAYYGGAPAIGVSARKNTSSMTLSTRFALQVNCATGAPSATAEIAVFLTGLDPSYTVTMDGARLSSAGSPTTLRCGSRTEHVLEVEILKDKPAGPIASTISFTATPKY